MNEQAPVVVNMEVPTTINEVISLKKVIDKALKEVMIADTHYGVIPGCREDKPSLLQPGAQVLNCLFGFTVPDPDIQIRDLGEGHREYIVKTPIIDKYGRCRAVGVGSASTMESKHRWRYAEPESTGRPVPGEYWAAKKAGRTEEMEGLLGGKGFVAKKLEDGWMICKRSESKIGNPDIADVWNTVLKMAKKRSYVQGTIEATASSDIFTQDIEDIPPEQLQSKVAPPKPQEKPQKQAKSKGNEAPSINPDNCFIYDVGLAKTKVKIEDGKKIINEVFKKNAGLIKDEDGQTVLFCTYKIAAWDEFCIGEPAAKFSESDELPEAFENIPGLD